MNRPNVVSVMNGYRILEKFKFSFQTLHVLYELRKFLPKYRIMWPMLSYLFWNLAVLFSNSSLGNEQLKHNRHSLIKLYIYIYIHLYSPYNGSTAEKKYN